MRSHDAGQHHHHRQVGQGFAAAPRTGAAPAVDRRCLQGVQVDELPRQRLEYRQPRRRPRHQPVAQRAAGIGVGEIAEVRDLGAAIEQRHRAGLRRDAGEHRRGIDHQVVVDVVEKQEIGEQYAQALEQVAALDIAGQHRHADRAAHRCGAQQPRHRGVGQHRLDAGHQVGVGAVLRDLDHDPLEGRIDRAAEKHRHLADEREQARQEEVEVGTRQPRALGRARDPHVALHVEALAAQLGRELAQHHPLFLVGVDQLLADPVRLGRVGVAGARQVGPVVVDQRVEIGQAQQVGDQAAARVRDQADAGALGQRLRQRERVLDRALGQGAVLEREHPAAELALQRRPQVAVGAAQVAEAAERGRPGAVNEDQHRALFGRGIGQLLRVDRLQVGRLAAGADPVVQPRLLVQARLDRPHQRAGAGPADAEFGEVFHGVAQPALGRIDDRVARLAHQHRMHLADQPADGRAERIADEAARRALGTQPLEQDLAVVADQVGPAALQRRLQLLGAGDEGRAVGQLEHQHLVVTGRVVQRLARPLAATAARDRPHVVAGARAQVAVRQERVVALAGRTRGGAQQRRQRGLDLAAGQLEGGGVGHGGLRVGSLRGGPSEAERPSFVQARVSL